MSPWQVYVLRCADGTLYTGIATDLERRLREHNGEIGKGAKYTAARRPVELVYAEGHADRSAAAQREAAIKRMSRAQKLMLIEGRIADVVAKA
jgi:putative endonuclease